MKIDPRLVLLGATVALWPGFANAEMVPHIPVPQVRVHIQPPRVHVPKPNVSVRIHAPGVHAHSPKIGISRVAAGATGHQIKTSHGAIASGHAHAKVDRTAPSLHAKSASPSSASQQTNSKGNTKGSTATVEKAGLSPASSSSSLASTLISMCPKPCTLSPGGEVVTWGTPGQPGSGSISYNGTNAQGQATYEYAVNGGAFPSQLGSLYGTANGCVGNACDYFFIPKISTPPSTTTPPTSSSPPPSPPPHGTGVVNVPPPPPAVSDDGAHMGSGNSSTAPSNPAPVINPVLPPRAPGSLPVAVLPPTLLQPGQSPPMVGNPGSPPSANLPPAVLPPSASQPGKPPLMVGNPETPPSASLPNAVLPPAGPPRKPVIPVPVSPGGSANGSTPSHPPAVFAMPGGSLFAAVYDDAKGGYVLPGGVVMPAQSGQLLSTYASTYKYAPSGGITGPGVPGGYVAPNSNITGLAPQSASPSGGMNPTGVAPRVGGEMRSSIELKSSANGAVAMQSSGSASNEHQSDLTTPTGDRRTQHIGAAASHGDTKSQQADSSPSNSSPSKSSPSKPSPSMTSKTSEGKTKMVSVDKSSTASQGEKANSTTPASKSSGQMRAASTTSKTNVEVGADGTTVTTEIEKDNLGQTWTVKITTKPDGSYTIQKFAGSNTSGGAFATSGGNAKTGFASNDQPAGSVGILDPSGGSCFSSGTCITYKVNATGPLTCLTNCAQISKLPDYQQCLSFGQCGSFLTAWSTSAPPPPTTAANNPPPPSSPQSGSSGSAPHNSGNDLGAAFNPPPLNGPGTSIISGGRTYLPGDLGLPSLAAIDAGHTDGGNDRGSSGNTSTSYASNDNSNSAGSSLTGGAGADNSGSGDNSSWGMSLGDKGQVYGGLGMIIVGGIATLATGGMGPAIGIAIAIGGDVLIYSGTKGTQDDGLGILSK